MSIRGIVTPYDNFVGRSKVRFGVGEVLRLSFETTPPNANAASFGGLSWYVKTGGGTVVNAPGNTGLGRYICPSTATAGTVTLELRTMAVPAVVKYSKSFNIVEPSTVLIRQIAGTTTYHVQGVASAGFKGEIFLQPVDVSFSNLQIREGSAPSSGTGSMAQVVDNFNQIGNVRHRTMGTWVDVGDGNFTNGCKAVGTDRIKALNMNPPFAVGRFEWRIPWYYRVKDTQGTDRQFAFMNHVEAVDATGTMSMTKGGTTVVCQAADATSTAGW